MADRRDLGGARLLDPVWHELQAAAGRLYREIEGDALPAALTLVVLSSEGMWLAYSTPLAPPYGVTRSVAPDMDAIRAVADEVLVDATPDEP